VLVKLRAALHRFLTLDFLGYTQPNYSFKAETASRLGLSGDVYHSAGPRSGPP
jgi:hypothetical protein